MKPGMMLVVDGKKSIQFVKDVIDNRDKTSYNQLCEASVAYVKVGSKFKMIKNRYGKVKDKKITKEEMFDFMLGE